MGHLRHMPTHLYVQLGDYARGVRLNREAVAIDARDRARSGKLHLYALRVPQHALRGLRSVHVRDARRRCYGTPQCSPRSCAPGSRSTDTTALPTPCARRTSWSSP